MSNELTLWPPGNVIAVVALKTSSAADAAPPVNNRMGRRAQARSTRFRGLDMIASLRFALPFVRASNPRHRVRAQVEVNQPIRQMIHVKMVGNLSQSNKFWP